MEDLIWKKVNPKENKGFDYLSIGGLLGDRKFVGHNPIISEEDWNKYHEEYMDYYRKLIG